MMQLTPNPFATPAPIATYAPISERVALSQGLDLAEKHARALDGTLGAVIIDVSSGVVLDRNGDASFPMASVQKLLVAVAIYRAIDRGDLALDADVTVQPGDIVPMHSSIAQAYPGRPSYSIGDLLRRMLIDSDNTAAKTLTRVLGGLDALNTVIRELGYAQIVAGPDDDGSATPLDLARALNDMAFGAALRPASRNALLDTLGSVDTFPGRLRAGLPPRTRLAHKTGTVESNGVETEINDAGIAYFGRRPMIIVAMLNGAKGSQAQCDAVLADVARAAAATAAALGP